MVNPSRIPQQLKTLTSMDSYLMILPILVFSKLFLNSPSLEILSTNSIVFPVKSESFCWEASCQVCTPKQLQQIAQNITVKILSGSAWGSGILVRRQGNIYTVLTNQHILTPSDPPYSIQTPDGKIYSAHPISNFKFSGEDLALLQFESETRIYAIANLQTSPKIQPGDKVFGAGFPWLDESQSPSAIEINNTPVIPKNYFNSSILSKPFPSKFSRLNDPEFLPKLGFHLTRGRVSLLSEKAIQQGYQIGYTNPIQKGMSGGPLLNLQGKVIGINGMHAYPLWGDPYIYQDGSLPSPELREKMVQLAFAIPIERVTASLSELNQLSVSVALSSPTSIVEQQLSEAINIINYPDFDYFPINNICKN
ncbi:putative peptidase S1 and S6 chymotrypsin/Hap [Planktothrix serta PCC 8927]|uniref:Peptidase S1 and S6 chymotrypsin/Hap n=1 Tax=Planktothrix serta PCC 8927 TaxID=671068 RepID=A0A7Z9E4U9_9CYAN|nr:serine protease [Planktothrix serta]VXD24851.1 putative peptidase S1 and S6 chymotrypsin/Hap [Planktothrix serta PCC 8927]